ncbi:MAG: LysR family transcriptional regulator [Acidimicrobiia bacterium]|nr:LysR family transcriptional regulator [Acidimicrobiia bacterium]
MTPTQLRSFATVVRLGSVRAAAKELGVTEAAVSGSMGALRKELDDKLFHPSREGLVFTPGGLRLAHRAVEMLGLQEQTRREVHDAHDGRRLLRVATTSLFAEYAAPGLIELFSTRADDLEVELLVESSPRFNELLMSHGADVAIGPKSSGVAPFGITSAEFMRYEVIGVVSPTLSFETLSELTWFLGPSAVEPLGVSQFILERCRVPESMQRIHPSHSAAVAEARNGNGIALVPRFAVSAALQSGALVVLDDPACKATGTWAASSLPGDRSTQVARELLRFVTTPRAIQAMRSGSGTGIGRFKPRVHITLWS